MNLYALWNCTTLFLLFSIKSWRIIPRVQACSKVDLCQKHISDTLVSLPLHTVIEGEGVSGGVHSAKSSKTLPENSVYLSMSTRRP